jgi:1-deoxyxylulose-5-phosphate synthase
MKYTKLGRTGLDVSRICLGCMSYGEGDQGNHAWSLGEKESRPFIKRALETGINFFDTANRYSIGSSEEILGRAIRDFARRDEVVIATKVYGRMRPGPNRHELSRKAVMIEIDASLRRLGTDYVDLYQIHRWDYETPIEETLEGAPRCCQGGQGALHRRLVDACLAVRPRPRHCREKRMDPFRQHAEPRQPPLPRGGARNAAALRSRGHRRHPVEPQARGRVTRDWDYTSVRTETDGAFDRLFGKTEEAEKKVVNRVAEVAAARGIRRPQLALVSLLAKPVITAPIVGATKLHHLEDALAAVNVKLSTAEIAALEEPYVPHAVVGFV